MQYNLSRPDFPQSRSRTCRRGRGVESKICGAAAKNTYTCGAEGAAVKNNCSGEGAGGGREILAAPKVLRLKMNTSPPFDTAGGFS